MYKLIKLYALNVHVFFKLEKNPKVIPIKWQMAHGKNKCFRDSQRETITLGWGHPQRFLLGRIWVGTEGCLGFDKQRRGRAERSDSMACLRKMMGWITESAVKKWVKVLKALVVEGLAQ